MNNEERKIIETDENLWLLVALSQAIEAANTEFEYRELVKCQEKILKQIRGE